MILSVNLNEQTKRQKKKAKVTKIGSLTEITAKTIKEPKMLTKHTVEGFDAFKAKVEELSATGTPLFVCFSGSKVNGKLRIDRKNNS